MVSGDAVSSPGQRKLRLRWRWESDLEIFPTGIEEIIINILLVFLSACFHLGNMA